MSGLDDKNSSLYYYLKAKGVDNEDQYTINIINDRIRTLKNELAIDIRK